jgi:hypothetical protein
VDWEVVLPEDKPRPISALIATMSRVRDRLREAGQSARISVKGNVTIKQRGPHPRTNQSDGKENQQVR